jgi:hypothetical protein
LSQHPDERSGEEVADLLIDSAVRYIVTELMLIGKTIEPESQPIVRAVVKGTLAYLLATAKQNGIQDEVGRVLAILALEGEG